MTLAELVAQLVLVAAGFSGLAPLPARDLPPLETLEPAALAAQACPMQPRQCQGIVAYFDADRRRILLSSRLDLDDAGDNSFVVHELVHVLEWHHSGGQALQGCEASLRSERRAYRVQNAYLRQQGRRERHGQMLSGMACAPTQPSDQSMVLIPAASAYRERMVLEDFIADVEAGEAARRSP